MKSYLVIFSILAGFNQRKTAYAGDNDELATAAANLCEEKAYLDGLKQHLRSAASQKKEDARTAEALARKWQIVAATSESHDRKCLFLALSTHAEKIAETNAALAKAAEKAVQTAAEALSEHIGAIEAAELFAQLTFKLPANFKAGTTAAKREFPFTLDTPTNPLCQKVDDLKTIGGKNKQPTYEKLHTIKLTERAKILDFIQGAKATISGLQSCDKTDDSEANYATNMNACQYQGSWTATAALLRKASPYAGQDTQLFKYKSRSSACAVDKLTEADNKDKTKDLTHLLCKALKTIDKATANLGALSGNTLAEDQDTLNIIRNCNPQFQTITDISAEEGKAIKKYVKEAYGEDNTKFSEKFIKSLSQIKPTVRKDKTSDATKSVEEIAGTVDARAAQSHAEGKRIKREIEAEKKSATASSVGSKKAEDCKEETAKDKCNGKAGCEFKDGECKVKVITTEKASGLAGNTTASNSFVVNKAPLLLAFLILAYHF
uniref:Variant surface glycoprotein 1125.303 n=1 Tax=Trypanosoma brucei TaxID=5691 RepID=A0A1J0R5J7_9TRYP|nr:variant surface glycoprotein 1125.303 [Trypanosoma brucei]